MSLLLLTIYYLLFTILAWRRIDWALALVSFALPSYLIRFQLGFVPMTLLEGMILIVFVVWLIQNFGLRPKAYNLRLTTHSWFWPILLFLLAATLSVFISPNLRTALGIWKAYFIEPILFLVVFVSTIKNKRDLNLIIMALGLGALAVSGVAIFQKFTGLAIPNPFWRITETRRVTSVFGYPNAVGLYLAPLIVLYIGKLLARLQAPGSRLRIPIYDLLVITFSLLAIIFAVSKGAWVGMTAGVFFLGVVWNQKTRLATFVGVIIFVLIILAIPQVRNFLEAEATFQSVSGQVRVGMWQETFKMIKDRPIFGAGLAGYQIIFAPYHQAQTVEIYLYPHNIFLNFWSEIGLGGLVIFLWILVKFFVLGGKLLRSKVLTTDDRLLTTALMAAMITLLVHGLVDVPYFKNDLAILFWLVVGMMIGFEKVGSVLSKS